MRDIREEAHSRATTETVGLASFSFSAGVVLAIMLRLGGSLAASVVYGIFLGTLLAVVAAVILAAAGTTEVEVPEAVDSGFPWAGSDNYDALQAKLPEQGGTCDGCAGTYGSRQDALMFELLAGLGQDADDDGDIYLDEHGRREYPPTP